MKFLSQKLGQTGLLISLCVFVSACNPEEYFPTEEFIEGIDAYCSEAKDESSCSSLQYCQPAYNDTEINEQMIFAACVANPDYTGGSTTGGSTGGTTGGSTGGSTDVPPTIEEAWQSKCADLDDRFLYVKKLVSKKQTTKVVKVKVCHETGNGSVHTIIIACPALKAHKQHNDYLGSCEQ
jgi:hypothetical protein